ncbi:hypothetical protein GCM10027060_13700 [Nesterenkonia halophila]
MTNRRNLGVAAVTAAVVTTALVGTTLPDLLADRAAHSDQQNPDPGEAGSIVETELPDAPSGEEIDAAQESPQAREGMIEEITERLSQANQRALELEASTQVEQQDALEAEQTAEAAEQKAEEAQEASEKADRSQAEQYKDGETGAGDVLLSEDEDALADSATREKLDEQAQQEAEQAQQEAAEAENLAEQAQERRQAAEQARDELEDSREDTDDDARQIGETALELVTQLAELNDWDVDFTLEQVRANSAFVDEDGELDLTQLGHRIDHLRSDMAGASQDQPAEAAGDQNAEDPADGGEGEASPSAGSEASEQDEGPVAPETQSLSDYQDGTRNLVERYAALQDQEPEEAFREIITDDALVDSSGMIDFDALLKRITELEPEPQLRAVSAPAENSEEQDEAPAEDEAEESAQETSEEDEGDGEDSDQAPEEEQPSEDPTSLAAPEQQLSNYLPETHALVEEFAELRDKTPEQAFDLLIGKEKYTDDDGLLDFAALSARVEELRPEPELTEQEQQDQQAAAQLQQYRPATQELVEEFAELRDKSAERAFQLLIGKDAYTDDEGVLDFDALDERVAELRGEDEDSEEPATTEDSAERSEPSLSDYLQDTRDAVGELGELIGKSPQLTFRQLIEQDEYTTDEGALDHQAILRRIEELHPEPEPQEQADEEPADSDGAASESDAESESEDSGLAAYREGTRSLVGELGEIVGKSPQLTFRQLIQQDEYTTDDGVLDHAAVQARVDEMTAPEPDPEPEPESSESSDSEESSASNSDSSVDEASGPSLSQYLPGTRSLVGELGELLGKSPERTFDQLIAQEEYTEGGVLDHAAIQARVDEMTAPEPEPESSDSSDAESSSSSSSDPSLAQYMPGTRGLVTELAELQDRGVQATFERILADDELVDSNGVIDHAALQRTVDSLQEPETATTSGETSTSDSSSTSTVASSASDAGAAATAVSWAVDTVTTPGVHYVLGAEGPSAYDCSSLVQQAFAQAGVSVPRTANQQFQGGRSVSLDNLQPGDLVFWTGADGTAHHDAIYIGDGKIAHARNPQAGVGITDLYYAYQDPNPVAKRYF